MPYTLTGTVKEIFETQTFPSGFSKREFVVTSEDDKFPQDVAFQCLKEKASLIDSISKGDRVTVHFDISGREYNGRYFVNLNAWKLDAAAASGGGSEKDDIEDPTDYGRDDEEPPF